MARLLGTFQDITEHQQAEETRNKLEAQMRQTQKLESLGVLAGGIAHDFNNILHAILGNAGLMLPHLPEASLSRKSLTNIIKASKRAADLCQQMLAYSGRGTFIMKEVQLSKVVSDIVRILDVSITKKADLRLEFDEAIPPIKADSSQIHQVVMNLVTNASESLGKGSGEIVISLRTLDCEAEFFSGEESYAAKEMVPGKYVVLEVLDTGCGMDESTRKRLFEPFFSTKFTGRGLGMAAVLGIIRAHQGAIQVQSEPGRGSKFIVYFPALEQASSGADQGAQAREAVPREQGVILVVDDEQMIRSLSSKMLNQLGYTALTAEDGQEGVEIFRQHAAEITCVVLDLTMPNMSGDEALRELRMIDPSVPVVVISGYHEHEVALRFSGAAPPTGFLHKPFGLDDFSSALEGVLLNQ